MRVKVLTSWSNCNAFQCLPDVLRMGDLEFVTDSGCRDYDWLVVYDELPRKQAFEELACPPGHTILVTQEPASIKLYNPAYTEQFNYVLTTQDPTVLRHRHYRRGTGCLVWLNGRTVEENMACPEFEKTEDLSVICSNKQQKHTSHHKRFSLISYLAENIPGLTWYGWGFRPLGRKYEAMDAYRYHITSENDVQPYHWTEKVSDAFLSLCLPFYAGDPELERVLPPQSFIRIPMDDPAEALRIIREAIANNEYEKRLPAIREARRLIVERYNLWAQVAAVIAEHEAAHPGEERVPGAVIRERHALRRNPVNLLREGWYTLKNRLFR